MNFQKYHLRLSSNNKNRKIELTAAVIKNTQMKKLLGIHNDYQSKFETHVETLCEKGRQEASCTCSS